MDGGLMTETAVYDLPHKRYIRTITVHYVGKSATLLILSANDQKVLIHPLTRRTQVDNMRPVHTIPL
jgi:hypothetical protein